MKKYILVLVFASLPFFFTLAQKSAGEESNFEYRYLIDIPTAGVLEKGFAGVALDMLPQGILIGRLDVGVFENLSFGISYGGINVVGSGEVTGYKYPGVNIRYKIIDETYSTPMVAIGFDSQGKGEFFESDNRYAIKSPGLFGAASKNYAFMGYLSLHAAINYSLETKDDNNFANLQIGVEKTIGKRVSFVADYNFTFNDHTTKLYGKGNGYLNAGFRWAVGNGFTLGFDFRDLLNNKKWSPSTADRAIHLEYVQKIL